MENNTKWIKHRFRFVEGKKIKILIWGPKKMLARLMLANSDRSTAVLYEVKLELTHEYERMTTKIQNQWELDAMTYLLFLYLSWIACCWQLTALQCDSLNCWIKTVIFWIGKPVKRSSRADQIGSPKLRRAKAIAAAEIIDGVYCRYGSASNNDSSHKYCRIETKMHKNPAQSHAFYSAKLQWLDSRLVRVTRIAPYLCHVFHVFW